MSIPKRIISIWLAETNELPPLVAKCLPTHNIPGYEHLQITLENCYKGSRYVRECLETKKWAKAADYLRVHYLNELGGIYLDADCEVIGRFDDLLEGGTFCGEEENGFASNAIIGSVPGAPLLSSYLSTVEANFLGGGELVYQPGMYLWTEYVKYRHRNDVKIFPPEFFLPYNWQSDRLNVTGNTRCIHWFNKSWL